VFNAVSKLFAADDVADVRALLLASSVRFFFLPLIGTYFSHSTVRDD
jgi:hypothetical protein